MMNHNFGRQEAENDSPQKKERTELKKLFSDVLDKNEAGLKAEDIKFYYYKVLSHALKTFSGPIENANISGLFVDLCDTSRNYSEGMKEECVRFLEGVREKLLTAKDKNNRNAFADRIKNALEAIRATEGDEFNQPDNNQAFSKAFDQAINKAKVFVRQLISVIEKKYPEFKEVFRDSGLTGLRKL